MQIVFGWGYDGARWSDRDSLRRYVTGTTGLTSLLATRLGLTTPDVSHVQRIAAAKREALTADCKPDQCKGLRHHHGLRAGWYGQ